MTTLNPIQVRGASDPQQHLSPPHQHHSRTEKLEEDAAVAGVAAAGSLRGIEVASIVLLGLLICPPLAIVTVLVVVPMLVTALVFGLLFAVISAPFLLFHHFRADHGDHAALLKHRLRHAGRAVVDLAPHRIVRDVRKVQPER